MTSPCLPPMRANVPDRTEHRLPPQNLEAEMSVLGGILLENEALNRALEVLRPEDFYREAHRKIFTALITLSDRNEPADLVTLTSALKAENALEEVGGSTYLSTLVDFVPTAANISYYCKLVKEKAISRELIKVATEIGNRELLAGLYGNLGLLYKKRGEFSKAYTYLLKNLEMALELGSIHGIVITQNNMGSLLMEQGQYEKALDYFNQALERVAQLHNALREEHEALTTNNLSVFESSVERKLRHTAELEQVEQQLFSLLRNAGYNWDKQGLNDYVSSLSSPADRRDILRLWKNLRQTIDDKEDHRGQRLPVKGGGKMEFIHHYSPSGSAIDLRMSVSDSIFFKRM